jgi:hypothetical protein
MGKNILMFSLTHLNSENILLNRKAIFSYDDPPILAGAGTIGMEIVEDVPCVDAVVVPVGGAGKYNRMNIDILLKHQMIT